MTQENKYKTAEEIVDQYRHLRQSTNLFIIREAAIEVAKEAERQGWNKALEWAAENARCTYYPNGGEVSKNSILSGKK